MENKALAIGDFVSGEYKTGGYLGEIVDLAPGRATVKILAVAKHPVQGDLHNPFQGNVPFFHQRRALAYLEKALVPLQNIALYQGDIPDYQTSLKQSLQAEMTNVSNQSGPWAKRALQELEQLQREYFPNRQ